MATWTSGAEFKAFYNDDAMWPKDDSTSAHTWHEDLVLEVDGEEFDDSDGIDVDGIDDAAKVKILGGAMFFEPGRSGKEKKDWLLEERFRKWRKAQLVERVVIEIDKAKTDDLKAFAKSIGAKVV